MIYLDKGYIGSFDMLNKEAGKQRLREYTGQLFAAGHKRIIAPIDGNTWHTYRLLSWTNGDMPFPMEPQNPLWYNDVYTELGFAPIMKYRSDKFPIKDIEPLPYISEVKIRELSSQGDLPLIHNISVAAFANNFLYSDLTYMEFAKLYMPVLSVFDPKLALIAEINGVPAGFMFSFMYHNNLVLKSMAVLPQFRSKGVGAMLMNAVLLAGQKKGATTAIAALMAEGNNSRKIVEKYNSEKFREYTLYALEVSS